MKVTISHVLNIEYPNYIEKTIKEIRVLGILIYKKEYYYPKLKEYEVVNI